MEKQTLDLPPFLRTLPN